MMYFGLIILRESGDSHVGSGNGNYTNVDYSERTTIPSQCYALVRGPEGLRRWPSMLPQNFATQ